MHHLSLRSVFMLLRDPSITLRQAPALLALLVPRAELVSVRSRVVTVATCHVSRYQPHAPHPRLELENELSRRRNLLDGSLRAPFSVTCWQTLAAPAGLPDPAEVVSIRTLVIALTICNVTYSSQILSRVTCGHSLHLLADTGTACIYNRWDKTRPHWANCHHSHSLR